jgi:hypothetical protein
MVVCTDLYGPEAEEHHAELDRRQAADEAEWEAAEAAKEAEAAKIVKAAAKVAEVAKGAKGGKAGTAGKGRAENTKS